MRRRPSVQKAFDEVRFGPTRILNLRDGLPSGHEATRRADGWLRAKQIERAGEVLVITGRGNGSLNGVPIIRTEIERLFARLRRRGVIERAREHTPGSFVVTVAPLRALFEAAARHRDARAPDTSRNTTSIGPSLEGLDADTLEALRQLAERAIESLGVRTPTSQMVQSEMERQFALLTRDISPGDLGDSTLAAAIGRALTEYDDSDR